MSVVLSKMMCRRRRGTIEDRADEDRAELKVEFENAATIGRLN